MRRNSGFGLIELLIVIAIIGVLAGLILASVNISRARSYDVHVKSGVRQLRLAAENYGDSNNDSYDGYAGCIGTPSAANCLSQSTADSIQVLIDDIVTSNGVPSSVSASSDATGFCVAAPLKSAPGSYVCADKGGELSEGASTTSPCSTGTSCVFN